jgi:hypothetical protein
MNATWEAGHSHCNWIGPADMTPWAKARTRTAVEVSCLNIVRVVYLWVNRGPFIRTRVLISAR